jgi:hypothetical protein
MRLGIARIETPFLLLMPEADQNRPVDIFEQRGSYDRAQVPGYLERAM